MVNYVAGTTKGETEVEDLFNNPFRLGDASFDEATQTYGASHAIDSKYTSARIVESATGDGSKVKFDLMWEALVDADTHLLVDGKVTVAGTATTAYSAATVDGVTSVTFTSAPANAAEIKIGYLYDNIIIPQKSLPTLKAEMKSIPLIARARRIAIYYSQIAAFQSKTDYGLDLGDQLAQQAVGRLQYEIDTEVTDLLIKMAGDAQITWSKTLPVGVSKAEHYEGFSEVVEIAKQKVYDATRRFVPNYMLIASDILPVLTFIKGFSAASTSNINGPYFAGTLNGVKVFVTPNIAAGKFVVGVNGSDMMSSAAVYAPYMPIVPTQLLQFADGTTSQGFSTLYDLKPLNKALVVAGEVVA